MKKLFIGISVVIGLLLLTAIVLPFIIKVDQYRPLIVQKANEQINGKLELGKLDLSLWGQIRVQIDGLTLTDTKGTKMVAVGSAYFHVPFSSIFGGAPLITLHLDRPELNIVKDKAGKMNVMTLMKPAAAQREEPAASGAPAAGAKTPGSGDTKLPALAANARLGFELLDATILYKDLATALDTRIENFNFRAKDLSLARTTEIEAWADLNTKMGKSLMVKGPFRMELKALPQLNGIQFVKADVQGFAKADDLEIEMPGTFQKKKGMAANIEWNITATDKDLKIQKFVANFFNARVDVKGDVQLPPKSATPTAEGEKPAPSKIDIAVDSNDIDLKPWGELLPMLSQYQLTGKAKLNATANGMSDNPNYTAKFKVEKFTAKAGNLKAQPEFNMDVDVVTNELKNFLMTMNAPGNDLKIQGKVVDFKAPNAMFTVTSNSMDLDQLIDFPPPPAEGAAAKAPAAPAAGADGSAGKGGAAAKEEDKDALLEPVRSNAALAAMQATVDFNLKMIKAQGTVINGLSGKVFFKNLTAGIENFATHMFDGSIGMSASLNMAPKVPTYQFSMKVAGLDIKKAVQSKFALFKHSVYGKVDFNMAGSGASLNPTPMMKNLNTKGSFKVADATFANIDVNKMVAEGLNGALQKIGDKIPAAKGKSIPGLPNKEARYESITSSFTIASGFFDMPDFFAKSDPNKTVDIKGSTRVGLIDQSLKTRWEVIDTYNLTKARDISVNQMGVNVDHILAEGNNPVKFPVEAGCTTAAPCYSYTQVAEYLGGVAAKNVAAATTGKAKSEVKKKVDEAIKQHVPENLQNKAQDIKKKIFGF